VLSSISRPRTKSPPTRCGSEVSGKLEPSFAITDQDSQHPSSMIGASAASSSPRSRCIYIYKRVCTSKCTSKCPRPRCLLFSAPVSFYFAVENQNDGGHPRVSSVRVPFDGLLLRLWSCVRRRRVYQMSGAAVSASRVVRPVSRRFVLAPSGSGMDPLAGARPRAPIYIDSYH